MNPQLIVAAGVALGIACGGTGGPEPAKPSGEPFPELSFPLLEGGTWRSSDARGSVQIVDVWASWCGPCTKTFPVLDRLVRRFPDLRVVAISIDEEVDAARAFVAQHGLSLPVGLDPGNTTLEPPLAVTHVPTVYVLDRAGNVQMKLVEPNDREYAELERLVERLMNP